MADQRRKRGFTLIELLVVIAIIGLLLSIIVPALKKAKSHAQRVIDFTNLRSLSIAIHLYLDANNDLYFEYDSAFLWMAEVGHLVDNIDQVRYSPKTTGRIGDAIADYAAAPGSKWGEANKPWLWGNSPDPTQQYQLGSYGLNGWLYSKCDSFVDASMRNYLYAKRTAVRNPGRTPVILDSNWVDAWPRSTNILEPGFDYQLGAQNITHGGATNNYMMGRFVMNRNGSNTNVVFADGQVASIPLAELWALSWHKGYQPNYTPVLPPLK